MWCKTVLKLEKALSGGPYRVVTTCKAQLEELQFYLPLMACLRTTVLRERHWKALYEITNMDESVGCQGPCERRERLGGGLGGRGEFRHMPCKRAPFCAG